MWSTIIAEYDKKGQMVRIDLHHKMTEKWIKDSDNVWTHLEEMALIYERLSGMGAQIHDQDYASMILMSLPKTYTMHLKIIADSTSSIR